MLTYIQQGHHVQSDALNVSRNQFDEASVLTRLCSTPMLVSVQCRSYNLDFPKLARDFFLLQLIKAGNLYNFYDNSIWCTHLPP
jgi:hypothetical protein